uniref:protein-tyrosine-phosphatase n=1 Tax=Saccoglossus kowalevskii TaxID=10224 RepID=A0ABM0MBZ4_SACKO|nr:PREDICTED: dual specificity protein phosphatase 12-like [Saccoglossus kowalevskii]
MHRIRPGLYLGCRADAYDVQALRAAKITHILTIELEPLEIHSNNFTYNFIQVADLPDKDLLSHFPECIAFIEDGIRKGGVMVHCFMGISRSTTVVLAYLMRKDKKTLDSAFLHVKQIKQEVSPNHGFMEQLRLFEAMGCPKNFEDHILYKQYKLERVARAVFDRSGYDDPVSSCIAKDPQLYDEDEPQTVYKCRMCRRSIFKATSILKHKIGKGARTFKAKSGKLTYSDQVVCTSIFIEPVAWMEQVLAGVIGGKLLCPKCNARLGSFNWAGDQCSCGTWVTPAFKIHCSKVDESKTSLPTTTAAVKGQPGGATAS